MNILKSAFGDNEDQLECASWLRGPLMVLAGPGVGKTRVLTHRTAYILRLYPDDAFRVLALTFTNKAADEMRGRLRKIPGYNRVRVWAGTFHGFCTSLLRQYSCYVEIGRSFTAIDDHDQLDIIRHIQTTSGFPRVDPRNIRGHVSRAKSALKSPEEYESILENGGGSRVPAQYYAEYERRMRASNMLDYDDLIWWTIRLLNAVAPLRRILHETYRFVLVDECQDTTLAQHELIGSLVPSEKPNLFAVADENQSIFEWNNARIRNLSDMIKRYGMEIKNLNRSYRCPPQVLRLASKIVLQADNRVVERQGELVSEKCEVPGCVSLQICRSEEDEAKRVLETIRTGLKQKQRLGDFAVIARTRFALREVEAALSDADIPYVVIGERDLLKAPAVAAYVAALRLLVNPNDAESLRALVSYINPGDEAIVSAAVEIVSQGNESLADAVRRLDKIEMPLDGVRRVQRLYRGLRREDAAGLDALTALDLVEEVIGLRANVDSASIDGDSETESLELLRGMARSFRRKVEDKTLPAFMAKLSLEQRGDVLRDAEIDSDHVKLLTVHAAKGTEYPTVVIVALEEGIFPHYLAEKEGRIDEERRNCFVAMTRTKERLIMSSAGYRRDSYGMQWPKDPSRFLQEIAQDVMDS